MAEPGQQMTPEQQEELRKKLENMSPEELREFQKKQCIFCHIVAGKVQAKKIYEDDKVLAVLDINPANPGHVLLMPKEHYMIMPQLPEDILQHVFIVAKQISNVLLRSLDVRGTNIIVANGPAAGQRAQHFMIHIIPRQAGDGVEFALPSRNHSEAELDKVVADAKKRLNELLGKKGEDSEPSASDILSKKEGTDIDLDKVGAAFKEDDEADETEESDEDDDNDKEELEENDATEEGDETEEDDDEPEEDVEDDETGEDADEEEDTDEDDTDEGDEEEPKKEGLDLDAISKMLNG